MFAAERSVTRTWPDDPEHRELLERPRTGLFTEQSVDEGQFALDHGPFDRYRRTVHTTPDGLTETTTYRLLIPWFGWLFSLPVRWNVARRGRADRMPVWAPPDRLDARQARVLGLLAAAAMASAFTNTLFTQTATFAADSFGVGDAGVGWGGAIVRAGIVIAIPLGSLADRAGRRIVIRVVAWAAPLVCALGALAPSFPLLVATQTLGRPLGLVLDLLIAVVAAEEMPRSSRAYAISVMAMASGLGAGIAVMALPLADLDIGPGGDEGWRFVYVVTLLWLLVAVSVSRHLPETARFTRPHVVRPPIDRRRLVLVAATLICGNFFIAPASFFQNRYLNDVRGLSATMVAVFTLCTATPAALGLVVGGRLADLHGRRRLIAGAIPIATGALVVSFTVAGPAMWAGAFVGGFVGGIAYPALAVYRAELFPTGNRGRANGWLTASALGGGILGILLVGQLADRDVPYSQAIGLVALGQLVVVVLVLTRFPETAHRSLEELNPEDSQDA